MVVEESLRLLRTMTATSYSPCKVHVVDCAAAPEPALDFSDEQAVAAFAVARLSDEDADVKHAALEVVQRDLPSLQRAQHDVAECLHPREPWFVRKAAVTALSRLPLDAAATWQYFGSCFADESEEVRAAAAGALCGARDTHLDELREHAHADVARVAASDESWTVRAAAVRALGRMARGDAADAGYIAPLLADSAAGVRAAALAALAAVAAAPDGNAAVAPHLKQIAHLVDDPQLEVRSAADALLRATRV